MYQFHNGNTITGTQVDGFDAIMVCSIFQSLQMANSQVHHMQVITLAGTVGGIIVATKYGQLFQLPGSHTPDVGHQVVGNTVGIVTQQAGCMGTDGVKVPQQNGTEVGMGGAVVGQDPLDHDFGPAIRRRRLDSRHLFLVRMGIIGSIDSRGGRENQFLAASLLHDFQQSHGAVQIVAVILEGLPDTLTHSLKACKMDNSVDLVVLKYLPQFFFIGAVDLIEGRYTSGDLTDPLPHIPARIAEIVHDNGMMACIHQFHDGMAADIAGTAGN